MVTLNATILNREGIIAQAAPLLEKIVPVVRAGPRDVSVVRLVALSTVMGALGIVPGPSRPADRRYRAAT
jgi:hypothetical protein